MVPALDVSDELDEIDLHILGLLQSDALTSYEDIGNQVGLAESTVRYRIKKMQELGVILGFTCVVDPKRLGYDLTVFAELDVEGGKERLVAQKLKEIPNVVGLFTASGPADMIALIVAKDDEELATIVERIRATKEVHKTTCTLTLKTYKLEYYLKIPGIEPENYKPRKNSTSE